MSTGIYCSVQCVVCSLQCAVFSLQHAVCSMQCTVCSMQRAVCSRVSMKAPHMMTKLLPPIFLFNFAPWLRIFFHKFFSAFFSTSGNFWTPPNPLRMKNLKNCPKTVFISSKEAFDALNATQKTQALNKVRFLKKSVLVKNGIFWRFFLIFSETGHC